MTAPHLPPTVVAAPPPTPRRNRRALAFGAVLVLLAVAAGWYLTEFGIDRIRRDDAAARRPTTTTAPASAGLVPTEGGISEIPELLEPQRGKAEAGGYRARLVGEEVSETSWTARADGVSWRGSGDGTYAYGAQESLTRAFPSSSSGSLESLVEAWMEGDDEATIRPATVAGRPGILGHTTFDEVGDARERFVLAFDGVEGPMFLLLDGSDVSPETMQREWLALVSSVVPA